MFVLTLNQRDTPDAGDRVDALLRTLRDAEPGVPVYGFRSLHAFKVKFGPEHVPLHLWVPDPAQLPRVGAALTRAYLPTLTLGDLVRAGGELRRKGS